MLHAPVNEAKSQDGGQAKRPLTPLPERERYPLSVETPGHPSLMGNGSGSIPPSAADRNRSASGSLQRLYGNQAVLQMRKGSGGPTAPLVPLRPSQSGILQRKCACGGAAGMSGECEECSQKKHLGLQTKLKVNEPGDAYEQEADRVADQVMAAPVPSAVTGAPLRIQRCAGRPTGQIEAPVSVDQALASPGRPLEPALRQDMEERFGRDFSRVRVHSGAAAEQSARDVSAHAYTMGHDIVFGAGRFAPGTQEGRRLITHELAHVIQQTPPSPHQPSSSRNPTSGKAADSIATGIRHLPSPMLQRDVDSEVENPWDKLSPSVRKKAQELYDDCDDSIGALNEAQLVRVSSLRSSWLNFLRRIRSRIEELDSDSKLAGVKNSYKDFDSKINSVMAKFREEWVAVEKRYLDEHRWLLSANVKSTDSIEAAKYLDQIYQQTKPSIPFLVTDDDYVELKNALDKQEYIRVGALRGARIRAKQLNQMMRTVADLLRKGEDANKFIPEWSDRVLEEAAYLDSFATLAKAAGREYAVELADLRKQLLEKQQETLKVKPPEESGLEKVADFVEGGVEAIAGIFVEAAKEAVDLVQINLHFVTFGKYEPKFISDMAAAAEQGASTGDLLKGMVTGIVETPSRFLKACRDGDWKAIGRESVNLYMLAKTIKEAPETIKKIPEAAKKLPELLAKTRESLRILRERTVALGLKNEGRLLPEPASAPVRSPAAKGPPAPTTPAPTLTVKQGGGQGSGKPTGMLRDTDAASRGVKVDASSHPVFKDKPPANDPPTPPQGQAAKVAVNATKDVPHGQTIDPAQGPSAPGQNADPIRMAKKPPTSNPKRKSDPPAAELDPGEGELSRKQRRGSASQQERISTPGKTPIKGSEWLNGRLSGIEDQRLFLQWIEDGHYGEHPHLRPYDPFADALLEEWNGTLSRKRILGPRRGEKR